MWLSDAKSAFIDAVVLMLIADVSDRVCAQHRQRCVLLSFIIRQAEEKKTNRNNTSTQAVLVARLSVAL